MSDKLSIELTAKIDGLRDSFNEAIRHVNSFDKETRSKLSAVDKGFASLANDIDKSMGKASASTNKASNEISKNLAKSAQASASSGKAISVGSNRAAQALTDLGRVAQDAPYGFIGIQNNLNPLLESFQRLRAESGSNSEALKSLGQSLIGPAGIGIALSVVSAAVLLYQQYQQKASKETKKTESDSKSLSETYAELGKAIKSISDAKGFGILNASGDIAKLSQLYSASQDVNISYKDRKKLVDELQKQYPATFKNFSDEQILAGKAAKAYEQLNKQLINKAIIQANTENLSNAIKPLLAMQGAANKTADELKKAREVLSNPLSGTDALDKARKTLQKGGLVEVFADVNKKTKKGFLDTINEMLGAGNDLIKEFGAEIVVEPDKDGSGEKKLKSLAEILKELGQALLINDNQFQATFDDKNKGAISAYQSAIESLLNNGYKPLSAEVLSLKKAQQDLFQLPEIKSPSVMGGLESPGGVKLIGGKAKKEIGVSDPSSTDFFENFSEVEKKAYEAKARLYNLYDDLKGDLENLAISGISDTLSNLGSSIGEALMNGGNVLEAAGSSLLAGFGQFLSEYGRLLVAYGAAAILKSKLDAAALIPGAGLIAGPAAIAAGIALQIAGAAIGSFVSSGGKKSSSSGNTEQKRSIPAFASGVQNFRGGMAIVGERGPEIVNLPTGASVVPTGRTERMLSGGGQANVFIDGSLEVGLDRLYVRLQQTGKKLGRLG